MRDIKFRAWDKKFEEMVEVSELRYSERQSTFYPCRLKGSVGVWYHPFDDQCVLMQSVGLKDKNGKEIYEGDVLRLSDGDVSHHRIFWDNKEGRWFDERLEDGDSQTAYDCFDFVTDCKIVGNIYQNPEYNSQGK